MAKLTDREKALLEKLSAKAEAPDVPAAGRNFNISVDLGDADQVAAARKLGLGDLLDDEEPEGGEEQEGGEEEPDRKGYFKGGGS